jgi:DNA-directed RNA polymerase subunit beta
MASSLINGQFLRKDYSRIPKVVSIPNLIEVQKKSFSNFLQMDVKPEDRRDLGLQAMFKSVFPIQDFGSTATLEFVKYTLLEPKYTVEECHQKGMTYSARTRTRTQGRRPSGTSRSRRSTSARYRS